MAQTRVHAREFAECAVHQRPRGGVVDRPSGLPGLLPGVDGAREVAVVVVDEAEVGQQRDTPGGVRVGGEKRLQRGHGLGLAGLLVGSERRCQRRVLGRRTGAGRQQQLGETGHLAFRERRGACRGMACWGCQQQGEKNRRQPGQPHGGFADATVTRRGRNHRQPPCP